MDLRQLEYFQMVARFNSFTKAAEIMHVAQPSVSNALQKLEQELGVSLVDRSRKRVSLTGEGRIFLQRVEDILAQVEDSISEMQDYGQRRKGVVNLGIPPMIGTFLFPYILVNFHKQHPDIRLNIVEEGSLTIWQMIENRELDLGIVIISEIPELLSTLPILDSEMVVCLNENHPLGNQEAISFEDLREEPLIMLKEGFYNREKILEHFYQLGLKPNIVLSSNQLETIKSLVSQAIGVSFLFKEVLTGDTRIASRPLRPPIRETIGLAWRKDRYLPHASKTFMDFMKSRQHKDRTFASALLLPHHG